ncbi:hypothetical protein JG688_00018250 [Phytophthora aleatoria]|uniref:Uncharacterized protein n=1 Tax=Phytophthora aleatoria TaxID=2496075 RepID=A0A8J5IPP6_9STRA|nr:hypothetical protein JG688_00018250 [Phytophthora aleatoria]
MTVHKVQGSTCSFVVFHSVSIPNISFAYVALSRIRHRNYIVITQRLTGEARYVGVMLPFCTGFTPVFVIISH